MKKKDKIWVKILKTAGVILILLVICIVASEELRNSLFEIIEFVSSPLFWFLCLLAIFAFIVLH